jgi:hypothetical protein
VQGSAVIRSKLSTAIGVLLALALLALAAQTYRLVVEQRAHADARTQHAEQRTEWERLTRVAVEAARTEEQRRTDAVQKEANEADRLRLVAESNAAAADDAGQRMRGQLAALTARLRSATNNSPAPVAGPGVEGSDALDLLAGMLSRHSQELVEVGSYADRLRVAGQTCERAYDALTPALLRR